ncbi:MAG: hypothetical protein WAN87_06000 [Thermoplasmata archaeon]
MNALRPRDGGRDRDLLSVGAGLAVIAGGLAVALPYLTGLTLAMACIVFAAWLVGSSSRPVDIPGDLRRHPTKAWFWISVALFAGTLILYFGAPSSLASLRGPALAVSPVACWWSSVSGIVRRSPT